MLLVNWIVQGDIRKSQRKTSKRKQNMAITWPRHDLGAVAAREARDLSMLGLVVASAGLAERPVISTALHNLCRVWPNDQCTYEPVTFADEV